MQFSIGYSNTNFTPVEVNTLDEFAKHATSTTYSCGIYKDNKRDKTHFIKAESIGLDFDGGMTVEEAKQTFANYRHLIMATKSHQIEKDGKPACDRFRVILFLSKPITNSKDFTATWHELYKLAPMADPACKDASRMFYPSTQVLSFREDGALVEPAVYSPPKLEAVPQITDAKGQLSTQTLDLFMFGAEAGQRNTRLYKAAKDCQQNGYTKYEVISMLENMISFTGNWASNYVNEKDIETIESAYREENLHSPRPKTEAVLNLRRVGDFMNEKHVVDWLVQDFLTVGGFSVIAGSPKSGKSTLTRQLAVAISRGGEFLGRQAKQGKVLYLALEEQDAMLQHQFRKLGVREEDEIYIHTGGISGKDRIDVISAAIHELSPVLVVGDTLGLLADIKDLNNYNEVNVALAKYRDIARKTKAHIITVHHTNKGEGTGANRILGSNAIFGAVDNAIIFDQIENRRYITSKQRGGRPFNSQSLEYIADHDMYVLDANDNDDF